jgi:hypothetical protein
LPAGLLIYAVVQVVNHIIIINDDIVIPMCIISIALMLIGNAYTIRCIGRRKRGFNIARNNILVKATAKIETNKTYIICFVCFFSILVLV